MKRQLPSQTLEEQFYVKGMSTRDIEAALTETLEVEGVSKSTVSTLCGQLYPRLQARRRGRFALLKVSLRAIRRPLKPPRAADSLRFSQRPA